MRRTRPGFTLLELLVVLGIIALLAGLVGPNLIKAFSGSKPKVTRQQIVLTETSVTNFNLDVGRFPTNEEGLAVLLDGKGIEKWNGPYLLRNSVPKDGWGHPLQYRTPASEGQNFPYEIFSLGADNKTGGEGDNKDLYSWQGQ